MPHSTLSGPQGQLLPGLGNRKGPEIGSPAPPITPGSCDGRRNCEAVVLPPPAADINAGARIGGRTPRLCGGSAPSGKHGRSSWPTRKAGRRAGGYSTPTRISESASTAPDRSPAAGAVTPTFSPRCLSRHDRTPGREGDSDVSSGWSLTLRRRCRRCCPWRPWGGSNVDHPMR